MYITIHEHKFASLIQKEIPNILQQYIYNDSRYYFFQIFQDDSKIIIK
jgi:hypothetical protein